MIELILSQAGAQAQDWIDLLNRVDAFYESAWTRLMWFLTVTGAIVVIGIPVASEYIRSRQFRADKEDLNKRFENQKKEINEALSNGISVLKKESREELDRVQGELEKGQAEIEKKLKKKVALVMMSQTFAVRNMSDPYYGSLCSWTLTSAVRADDGKLAQLALEALIRFLTNWHELPKMVLEGIGNALNDAEGMENEQKVRDLASLVRERVGQIKVLEEKDGDAEDDDAAPPPPGAGNETASDS